MRTAAGSLDLAAPIALARRRGAWQTLLRDLRRNRGVYLMLAPVVLYYLIFHYGPMYGAVIAFQDFNPVKGVLGSKWIGLQNFQDFFASVYFARLMVNTVAISVLDLVFGFPAPIILALLLNELRWNPFKGLVQTVTYLPHFISVVVVVGMLFDFFARDGLVNDLIASARSEQIPQCWPGHRERPRLETKLGRRKRAARRHRERELGERRPISLPNGRAAPRAGGHRSAH